MAIGVSLRSARERLALTLEDASARSHIPVHYLEALEDEAFDDIPAPVYLRGFLRVYGRLLDLDVPALLEELAAVARVEVDEPLSPSRHHPIAIHEEPEAWPVPELESVVGHPQPARRRAIPALEDDWEAELEPVVRDRANRRQRRSRPGHQAGVLTEREPAEPLKLLERPLVVLGGAGLVVVLLLILAVAFLRGGGGTGPAPTPAPDRTVVSLTVVPVRTPTATPTATSVVTVTGTPGTPAPSPVP